MKNIWIAPTKIGLYVIILFLAAITVVTILKAENVGITVGEVANSVKDLIKNNPSHSLAGQDDEINQLASQIKDASDKWGVNPHLLVAMIYCESSFNYRAYNPDKGEWGYMQVHGVAKTRCEKRGYNLDLKEDQIKCGTWWLSTRIKRCGNLERGLTAYACGRCETNSYKVVWIVRRRLNMARRLERSHR